MKIQVQFSEIQVQFNEIQVQFSENSISIQFQFNFNSISIQCRLCAKHLGSNIRESASKRFSRHFLTNKMEEHLRNLADSLGECSRLVSQVLASSSSSSNTKVPDSVTQVVSENNLSSTNNVASAVERARSMLKRSRSTGLCSRLSQL